MRACVCVCMRERERQRERERVRARGLEAKALTRANLCHRLPTNDSMENQDREEEKNKLSDNSVQIIWEGP